MFELLSYAIKSKRAERRLKRIVADPVDMEAVGYIARKCLREKVGIPNCKEILLRWFSVYMPEFDFSPSDKIGVPFEERFKHTGYNSSILESDIENPRNPNSVRNWAKARYQLNESPEYRSKILKTFGENKALLDI